ncbi:hypothetical protein GOB57_22245 [Sinorhizobium meliloti]|nr:hypothetical protein [Sinorhizobium meliloti]
MTQRGYYTTPRHHATRWRPNIGQARGLNGRNQEKYPDWHHLPCDLAVRDRALACRCFPLLDFISIGSGRALLSHDYGFCDPPEFRAAGREINGILKPGARLRCPSAAKLAILVYQVVQLAYAEYHDAKRCPCGQDSEAERRENRMHAVEADVVQNGRHARHRKKHEDGLQQKAEKDVQGTFFEVGKVYSGNSHW